MSTITLPAPMTPASGAVPPSSEERGVMRGVSWDFYLRLSGAIHESSGLHVAYDGKDLEIVSPGPKHEGYKGRITLFLNLVMMACRIRGRLASETTWERPVLECAIQADECGWFDPEKIEIVKRLFTADVKDITLYPSPELAIEIDISPPKVDRPGIYAAMGVTEVWRFDGETMVFEQLGADGKYTAVDRSRFLPVRPSDVVRWITDPDAGELEWMDRLTEWAKGLTAAQSNGS